MDAAQRICVQADQADAALARQVATAQRGSRPGRVYREVARLTVRRSTTIKRYVDRLDALTVPDRDRDELKAWIADQRRVQLLTSGLAGAFAARDDARIATLSQQIAALDASNAAFAARYGLPACATRPG